MLGRRHERELRREMRHEVVQAVDGPEPQRAERVEIGHVGAAALHRPSHFWKRSFQHARSIEEPPGSRLVEAEQVDQHRRVLGRPGDRCRAMCAEPLQHLVIGWRRVRQKRRRQRHRHGGRDGWRRAEDGLAVSDLDPSVGGSGGAAGDVRCSRGATQADPQQRWGHQRRQQDHDQQRAVLVGVEDSVGQTDRREDKTDLAAGDHPQPDQQPVGSASPHGPPGDQLAGHSDDGHHQGHPDHRGLGHCLEVGVHADADEEDRDEQVRHGAEIGRDPLVLIGPTQRQARHERTDDERELGLIGQLGERDHEREAGDHCGRARRGELPDDAEHPRDHKHADDAGAHQEQHRKPQRFRHGSDADIAAGDHLHDDGEDDQAQHVIGDGGPEHDPGLDRGECAEVSEHSCRDAHAGRGERGAEEHCSVAAHPERRRGHGSGGEWNHHTHHGNGDRRRAHLAELAEVHLHADRQQQQQHADLGEQRHRHAALVSQIDEPEDRWSDQDTCGDLPEHGWDAQSFGRLGRDLGGNEDDQQIEEQTCEVDGKLGGEHAGFVRVTLWRHPAQRD